MGDTGLEAKSNKVLVDSKGMNDSSGELTLEDRGQGLGSASTWGWTQSWKALRSGRRGDQQASEGKWRVQEAPRRAGLDKAEEHPWI